MYSVADKNKETKDKIEKQIYKRNIKRQKIHLRDKSEKPKDKRKRQQRDKREKQKSETETRDTQTNKRETESKRKRHLVTIFLRRWLSSSAARRCLNASFAFTAFFSPTDACNSFSWRRKRQREIKRD